MGFRQLECFNLALLCKHGWNCISNPSALICRILKAKYFSEGDFLNANLGNNPSYTWRDIWCSRVVLAKGIRWKVGNGFHINVWHDPWLRDANNFCIKTPMNPNLQNIRVCDLMTYGLRDWDTQLIEELFCAQDRNEICSGTWAWYG